MFRRAALLFTALTVSAFSLTAADVSGKWTFHVKFFLHNGDPWFQFQQTGEKLTGSYHGHFGEAPLNGTVKADHVEFTISDQQGTAVYSGDLNGDTIKGTAKYPFPLGTGHFEGKRSK
jgi:hypothetical protein